MQAETTHYKITYAIAADSVNEFPAKVSQVGAEKLDKELYEGNKLAAGQSYGVPSSFVSGTEYEASATRPVQVTVEVEAEAGVGTRYVVECGGKKVAEVKISSGASGVTNTPFTFICPAAAKFKVTLFTAFKATARTYLLL